MKAVVATFNQEKALVGAFSMITNLRMDFFEALLVTCLGHLAGPGSGSGDRGDDVGGAPHLGQHLVQPLSKQEAALVQYNSMSTVQQRNILSFVFTSTRKSLKRINF